MFQRKRLILFNQVQSNKFHTKSSLKLKINLSTMFQTQTMTNLSLLPESRSKKMYRLKKKRNWLIWRNI